jgi:hypothetical protein
MNAMNHIALLVAVAIPLATLVAINLALLFAGEEDTLLLPGIRAYPAQDELHLAA